ncbi:aspartate ammonia-lyase [Candidatus Micrarchaeota archaeon]|nr:aspartate ammonia-lyase [Candidatus Micrarchaeota archaeon]
MSRIEEDFIGKVQIPANAYYGSFTARAHQNFNLSDHKVAHEITYSVALIKKCAALANSDLGKLDQKVAKAIVHAADEVISGKFNKEFILDAFQAGAGTPLHMNVNEVIANRAEELLGGKVGHYKFVHPNNHVNMSQSSNDVTPTAIRLASLTVAVSFKKQAHSLIKILDKRGQDYKNTLKIGRTHLQDAVPMTYGQTFSAYASALSKDLTELDNALKRIGELGIGGTATGSGITTHPKFREKIVHYIRKETGLDVRSSNDCIELTQNMNAFLMLSAALRAYALTLNRIANDLRLLASGPKGGIAEIILEEVEPGSSIMPGKVNPSVPEAVNMVCMQVIANDQAILLGAQGGQLELNFCTPLIGHNLLEAEKLLTRCSAMFEHCITNLKVDEKRTKENFERSFGYATAFNPYLGYSRVSKLVSEAYKRKTSLRELIIEKGILSENDVDKIIASATGPSIVDESMKKSVERFFQHRKL